MRRYRKHNLKSWRKFLHKLDMNITLNICTGYLIPGKHNSVLYFKDKLVLICNNSDQYIFKYKLAAVGDLALLLRKYRLSRKHYRLFATEPGIFSVHIDGETFERIKSGKVT